MSGERTAGIVTVCVIGSLATLVAMGVAAPSPTPSNRAGDATQAQASPSQAAAPPSTSRPAPSTGTVPAVVRGTVLDVVDGDTVDVGLSTGERVTVRVLGIDTPETVAPATPVECWGPEATAFAEWVLLGQQVRLDADPTQDAVDRYGRTLAYLVLADGTDYAVAAAEAGAARTYRYDGAVQRHGVIAAAERRAQASGTGLWGAPCEGRETLPPPPPPPPAPEPPPPPPRPAPAQAAAAPEAPSSDCDPNYDGGCVPIASDVDCEGGSGNGPEYVSGPVRVVGEDVYGLDSDDDGEACE